jgi:hypothetical protein
MHREGKEREARTATSESTHPNPRVVRLSGGAPLCELQTRKKPTVAQFQALTGRLPL